MAGPTLSKNTADFELLLGGRYLLESVTPGTQPNGYLLEDGSGVLLLDTVTPSLGDPVTFTNPAWSGRVVSVAQDLIVDGAKRNYKRVSITATNQTADPGGTAPGDFSDVPAGGYLLLEDGSGRLLLESSTSGYSAAILSDAPAAYWHLADSGSTATDASGNSHTGTLAGGIATGTPGAIPAGDTAMTLNGTTGLISVVSATALHPGDVFSIEFWIKTTSTAQGSIFYGGANDYEVRLQTTGRVECNKAGLTVIMSSPVLNDGLWHHLVWTKNGGANKLYLDGADTAAAVNNATIVASAATVTIGDSVSGFLAGSLDEMAFYGTVLTSTQIAAHYAARNTTSVTDYLLLEGTSFAYRELSVRSSQNQDGTTTTYGSLITFEGGFKAGQTFLLTNNDLGYSAQSFAITNVTIDFIGAGTPTPRYRIEFGDAYQTLQLAGGGVLTRQASVATQQLGVVQPGGVLGYAQITAAQGSITAEVDITGLSVTVTVASGRRIQVSGYCKASSTTATDTLRVSIFEGATLLTYDEQVPSSTSATPALEPSLPLQPTAGVHTYNLKGLRTGGGTMTAQAGTTFPAWIMVTDIGT